ncbi:MAG TPA: SIMPL domain-containing protein [Hanamia sp.]|nr:SIMPL domain-containing protein [Hanamia sp.]
MKKIQLTAIFIAFFFAGHAQMKNFIDQPYIEVAGNADTLVTPDEIYIQINISEKDTKNKTSVEELERKMYDAIKSLGIDVDKNLTTSDISSNFKNYFLKGKEVLKSKDYMLKVKDAVTATKVFMKLEDLGISNSSIDHVDYSKKEEMKNIMRTRAMVNAKTRAEALTEPLHQKVGRAIYISDNENYVIHPMMKETTARFDVSGYTPGAAPLPEINFEKIEISSNINAKFILE